MANLMLSSVTGVRTAQLNPEALRSVAFSAPDQRSDGQPRQASVPAGCSAPKSRLLAQGFDPFSEPALRWNYVRRGSPVSLTNHAEIFLRAFPDLRTQQRELADAVRDTSNGATLIRATGFQPLLGLLYQAKAINGGRPLDFVKISLHGSSGVVSDGTRQHPGRRVAVGQLLNEMMGRGFIAAGRTTITLNACNVAGTKAGREKLWNLAQLLNINIIASPSLQYVGQSAMNDPMTFFHNGAVSGLDAKEKSRYGYMSLEDATR
jgi:hypothetical protein